MKRRKFLIWLAKVWGGYFGLAATGALPPLLKINTVRLGEARAAIPEPCVCEGSDLCICEANDLCICEASDIVVCPTDGHDEPCAPDTCTTQDGCLSGDTIVRQCRVSDTCDTDVSLDCRIDSCTGDSSGNCISDDCLSDSSGDCQNDVSEPLTSEECPTDLSSGSDSSGACMGDQCASDSSGACLTDTCVPDASGACSQDHCVADSSGVCVTDTCEADSSGACQTDNCVADKSGYGDHDDCISDKSGACLTDYCVSDASQAGWDDHCVSDSSGACRTDQCATDSSGACVGDDCEADSSGSCTGDAGTADASGACVGDTCVADSSGDCGGDRCISDKSAGCNARDVCVSDKSGVCDSDLCRSDSGWDCASRDVCASDITPPPPPSAAIDRALRWLYRLSVVLLAILTAPDDGLAATVIDARDAIFGVDPAFQTGQAVAVPFPAGAFIRDCDGDGIEEADTNGDGNCTGDPELRDYNGDGSRELPVGTPLAGTFQFACVGISSDIALTTTGPLTLLSASDAGIYGAVYATGNLLLAATGNIDLHTSAWDAQAGALTFRTALAGTVDQGMGAFAGGDLPSLSYTGLCGATVGPATEIPALSPWGILLLIGLIALVAWYADRQRALDGPAG